MVSHNFPTYTLEQLSLHELAKGLWNQLASQDPEKICISSSPIDLTSNELKLFKQRIVKSLQGRFPTRYPNLFKEKLLDAMVDIKLGYHAAYNWIMWHEDLVVISNEITKTLEQHCLDLIYSNASSKYEAIHFIKPLGRFDDLSWAKLFVADENQSLKSRFYLACLYCLEEDINSLWRTMKDSNQVLCEDDLKNVNNTSMYLIKLWVSRLLEGAGDNFFVRGWRRAFDGCHEHAAIFFWRHTSGREKTRILSDLNWGHVFSGSIWNRVGFVHFIYSTLTDELKYDLIFCNYSSIAHKIAFVLGFLLCSPYYKTILHDVLSFPQCVPLKFYKCILEVITSFSITLYKEVFKVLWNHLSQADGMFILKSSSILVNLIYINDFSLFEMIILPLPSSMKEEVLVKDFLQATPVVFFKKKDYEGFLLCLSYLLMDYDAESRKLKLRSNAKKLLGLFVEKTELYCQANILEADKLDVITRHLKDSLTVVCELINRMDNAIITHDFLLREIYPIFSVTEINSNRKRKREL